METLILFLGAFAGGAALGGSLAWRHANSALDTQVERVREARAEASAAREVADDLNDQLAVAKESLNPNAAMKLLSSTPGRQKVAASMTQHIRERRDEDLSRRRLMPPDMIPDTPLSAGARGKALIDLLGHGQCRDAAVLAHGLIHTLGPHGDDDDFMLYFVQTTRELGGSPGDWIPPKTPDESETPDDPWDGPLIRR